MHKVISLIQFSCGCGLKTIDAKEAVTHSSETAHTVTVGGTISPVDKPAKRWVEMAVDKDKPLHTKVRVNPTPTAPTIHTASRRSA